MQKVAAFIAGLIAITNPLKNGSPNQVVGTVITYVCVTHLGHDQGRSANPAGAVV